MELNCHSVVKFSTVVLKSLWKTNDETPQHSAMTWLNPVCTMEVQTENSPEYFRAPEINSRQLLHAASRLPNRSKKIKLFPRGQTFLSARVLVLRLQVLC